MLIIALTQVRVTVNFDSFYLAEDIQWLTSLEVLILSNNLLRVSNKFCNWHVNSCFWSAFLPVGDKTGYKTGLCVGYFPLVSSIPITTIQFLTTFFIPLPLFRHPKLMVIIIKMDYSSRQAIGKYHPSVPMACFRISRQYYRLTTSFCFMCSVKSLYDWVCSKDLDVTTGDHELACSWYNSLTKQHVCCHGCEDQGNR